MKTPSLAPEDMPLAMRALSKVTGIGVSKIYEHKAAGYVFQYSLIKKTSARHYLAWIEAQTPIAAQKAAEDAARIESELSRLRVAMAGTTERRGKRKPSVSPKGDSARG